MSWSKPAAIAGTLDAWAAPAGTFEQSVRKALASRHAVFVAACVPFVVVGALTFANTSDDPLITLRYAANLLHHGQPVFNLGERVEGYTSPLHLLVAALVLLTPGGLALLKLKLVSLIFAAATLWQTARLSRAARLPQWAQLSVMVAVAGSWDFMLSASNGLETSLVAFLATGAVASLVQHDVRARWWIPAIWTGFLALSRPDAALVIVCLAVASLAIERRYSRWRRVAWLVGPVIAGGGQLAFRIAYYHQLVPNTFYAKQLGPLTSAVRGLGYLLGAQPLAGVAAGLLVIALEGWLVWVGLRRFVKSRPVLGYPVAVTAAQVLFILESGGDWMKGGRFLVPAIPAAMVLVFAGVEAKFEQKVRDGIDDHRLRRATIALLVLLVVPVNSGYLAPVWQLSRGVGDEALIGSGNYPLSTIWVTSVGLGNCVRPGQWVAYSEAGLFGYEHQNLRVLDLRGLTSVQIARHATAQDKHPWGVEDPRWFLPPSPVGRALLSTRPQMIISFDATAKDRPGNVILGGTYRRWATILQPASNKPLLVYLRRGFSCRATPALTS